MATVDYIVASLGAVLLHELAHVFVATAMGIRIKRLGVSWTGPYVVREQGPPLANLCTALAAPFFNLALAALCWRVAPLFGLVNLALGAYNVLPFVRGLDGWHALAAYRELRRAHARAPVYPPAAAKTEYAHPVNAKSAA